MTSPRFRPLPVILLLGAAAAPAQGPASWPSASLGARASVVRQAHGVVLDGGVPLGIGSDYRARFTAAGLCYTPALGRRAIRELPLRFTTESMRRGDVVWSTAEPTAPQVDADRVRYERGAGITEEYHVGADGVELAYRCARPLGGRGDLVVRGRIDTELRPAGAGADGGLRFACDTGAVTVGGVTGIDAGGRRERGSLRLDGRHLELSLPAAFVDAAAFPLILDPLIGSELLVGGTADDDRAAEAAYDQSNDVYLVAWERSFSATNVQILSQRVRGTGTLLGTVIVNALLDVNVRPTVANVDASNRFLVAWQGGASLFGPWDIHCQAVDAASGAVSSTITVAANAGDETHPDSAGAFGTDDAAVLVWQEEGAGIWGERVRLPASGGAPILPGPPLQIATATDAREPAISRSHQTGARVLTYVLGDQIRVRAYDATLTALGPVASVFTSTGGELAAPDIDGDGTEFLCVYQVAEAAGSLDHDVRCRAFRWNGTTFGSLSPNLDLDAGAGEDECEPSIAYLGLKYVALWSHSTATPLSYSVQGAELDARCNDCGNRFTAGGLAGPASRTHAGRASVATRTAGGATGSTEGLIVFEEAEGVPPFDSDVVMQRYATIRGTPPVTLSPGCGFGVAGTDGPFAVGNTGFHFTLNGAIAGQLSFLSLAFAAPPLACGSCILTNAFTFEFKGPVSAAGTNSSALPLSCGLAWLVGLPLESQWVFFGGSASPCPLAAGLTASNRLQATLGF
jgi:hypothetical protein